jgi:hypothetical protein
MPGVFYVDDIRVGVPPVLNLVRNGTAWQLRLENLLPGVDYTIRSTTNFAQWTTTTIRATGATYLHPVPNGQSAFYQVVYTAN